jgi:hypothetical protein
MDTFAELGIGAAVLYMIGVTGALIYLVKFGNKVSISTPSLPSDTIFGPFFTNLLVYAPTFLLMFGFIVDLIKQSFGNSWSSIIGIFAIGINKLLDILLVKYLPSDPAAVVTAEGSSVAVSCDNKLERVFSKFDLAVFA